MEGILYVGCNSNLCYIRDFSRNFLCNNFSASNICSLHRLMLFITFIIMQRNTVYLQKVRVCVAEAGFRYANVQKALIMASMPNA